MTRDIATNFTFERLDVYRVAREALAGAIGLRAQLRGLPGEIAPQLERALVSVVANICEGCGRHSQADRTRHFAIARGSATEAGGLVEIAHLLGGVSDEQRAGLRSRLLRVAWMLTAMMRR